MSETEIVYVGFKEPNPMVYKAVVAGLETTKLFTGFMHRSGTLRNLPASWKDVWFENNWDKPGS